MIFLEQQVEWRYTIVRCKLKVYFYARRVCLRQSQMMATIQITLVGRTESFNSNQSAVILLRLILCYSHAHEFHTVHDAYDRQWA